MCEYVEEMIVHASAEIQRITEIYEKRIRELKDRIGNDPKTRLQPSVEIPECNCEEEAYAIGLRPDGTGTLRKESWVCQLHGYKKR